MQPLDKTLRNRLERTIKDARDIAEEAALASLNQLGVREAKAPSHLSDIERELRRNLRAHGRQLGNGRNSRGEQALDLLIEEVAYEHWHRMLFARFLADNALLMYPDPEEPVAITLEECEDLAIDEGVSNGWELASKYATLMLPQIFRPDSPVFKLGLPPEHQQKLERLVAELPDEVFNASDSLGWVYQFWQAKKKDEVNASEVKIGARELSAVTQLFTEPYMVSFLLDNTLGAWWAARRLQKNDFKTAKSEQELRSKASLPGLPLDYLRFTQREDGSWVLASGAFEGWPEEVSKLKILDPCCGSGHFLVAAFLMLVPIRMELEGLSEIQAVDAVLQQNIHGLELDRRCIELAAFTLALTAWRRAGKYYQLPSLSLACTGLSVGSTRDQWMSILDGQNLGVNLKFFFGQLYDLYQKAPTLGSLINPHRFLGSGWLNQKDMDRLFLALRSAVKSGSMSSVIEEHELGVAAKGLAEATNLLSNHYTLVVTNVPYLGSGKQDDVMKKYIENQYPLGKADLATAFVLRSLEFCSEGGTTALVTPQNWLFLKTYKKLRDFLIKKFSWNSIVRLGAKGFQTPMWDFNVQLGIISAKRPGQLLEFTGVDVSSFKTAQEKASHLPDVKIKNVSQINQLKNSDSRISFVDFSDEILLANIADFGKGSTTGDGPRFLLYFWELSKIQKEHVYWLNSPDGVSAWSGRSQVCKVPLDDIELNKQLGCRLHGQNVFGRLGVAVNKMRKLEPFLYMGEVFDDNICPICPKDESIIPALWAYVQSKEYHNKVREIDQALKVTAATLTKVPFDAEFWKKSSKEKNQLGTPKPYSEDPTQWLFHGHPFKCSNSLQVAVIRLLNYRWPTELRPTQGISEEALVWAKKCEILFPFGDEDGIVCIPPVRGEASAAERILNLLATAYGDTWSNEILNKLLNEADHEGKSLETWLRDKFFTQHCALFQNRPFIWHIWDGLNDGFAALINYHKFDAKVLETLIYTYLGDWISRQKQDKENGVDGAEEKLSAAEQLKKKLELILEGESPHDIFVRWKPLEEQPIGWSPDLNDGVRLNIRPFMTVPDVKIRGAGVLRVKPKIKWGKDRGKEIHRSTNQFPWFWGWDGSTDFVGEEKFTGERFNDCHYSLTFKRNARSKS